MFSCEIVDRLQTAKYWSLLRKVRAVVMVRPYSFVAQKCCVHSVLNGLFFRIDFKVPHDGALSSVLLLLHLWHCLCHAGTMYLKLPCFKGDTSCCFCTLWPSSSALGERGASPGAAQLAWRWGGESAAKQKECPNITYWELTRGQWNDLVQLKWEWSSWFIFHKQSGFSSKDCYLFLPLPHPAVASESKTLCYCPSAAPQSVKQSSFLTSGKASALNMLSNSLALSEKTPLSRI